MPNKSLIIVFTPLQFLNAQAYLKQFPQEYKVLMLGAYMPTLIQIKNLDTEKICNYPLERLSYLHPKLLIIVQILYARLFIRVKNYSEVVIGNYNSEVAYNIGLKFQRKGKRVILLDDGLVTTRIYRNRNQAGKLSIENAIWLRYKLFCLKLLRFKTNIEQVTFFSVYNLEEICLPKIDTVVKQNTLVSSDPKPFNNELWFIGQPLLEQEEITIEDFDWHIANVKEYAKSKGLEFYYIKHRSERPKKGLETKEFDLPLEVVVQNSKVYPIQIVSFYSSALINIASFFPQIKCSYINLYKTDSRFDRLQDVYDLFKLHPNLNEFYDSIISE